MYKRHCILSLTQRARALHAWHMHLDNMNGTDTRMGHADSRAIRFARALSQLVHRTRVAESF